MNSFSHYLSYGATDQQTARRLAGSYDGLLVPGTIAAFQRAGTGGFVLTLSATKASPDYMIDPRFPLFQQKLPTPKRSHEALAEIFGSPELVRSTDPVPTDFDADLIERVARGWVEFNSGYSQEALKSFDKYAQRLGEPVEPTNQRGPTAILPPYLIARAGSSDWWDVSKELFSATRATSSATMIRVVAAESPGVLTNCLAEVIDERVAIWVSGLNELTSSSEDLHGYGAAIAGASAKGTATFALYGGFFSVLLRAFGLGGSSHGIGYGESRSWVELPKSGPPPARFYLPRAHRYVSQDFAYQLWARSRPLAQCDCAVCNGGSPLGLVYQELMEHSVLCRAKEIADWAPRNPHEIAGALGLEHRRFESELAELVLPPALVGQSERLLAHLPRWATAIGLLARDLDL